MQLSNLLTILLTFFSLTSAHAITPANPLPQPHTIQKRSPRGGGGRGGFGGGRPSSGIPSRPPPNSLPTSSKGGTTPSGSGVQPRYGGYYAGGASVPYRSGARAPGRRGVAPVLLVGGGLGFWVLASGASWGPYGVYSYEFPANVTYKNETSGQRESLPAMCLCSRYAVCSCEVNGENRYISAVIGDGSYGYLRRNADEVQITDVNGTRTLVLNGTLANGTTAASAAGGGKKGLLEGAVWAAGAASVAWAVWCL